VYISSGKESQIQKRNFSRGLYIIYRYMIYEYDWKRLEKIIKIY